MATKKSTKRGVCVSMDEEMDGLQSNTSPGINYEAYNEQFGEGSSGKFFFFINNPIGEEQNIEMEILETGGRVPGLDLDGLGLPASKNEFLIMDKNSQNNPMKFPVFSLFK